MTAIGGISAVAGISAVTASTYALLGSLVLKILCTRLHRESPIFNQLIISVADSAYTQYKLNSVLLILNSTYTQYKLNSILLVLSAR